MYVSNMIHMALKHLHRCIEAHFQQQSLQSSNGTLCLLIVYISTDYLNKLPARMPEVCEAVIAANRAFFDKSKV